MLEEIPPSFLSPRHFPPSRCDTVILTCRWLHEIEQNCEVVTRLLVGNKNDDPDRKVVLTEDARRFADQMGIQLFETSAKENLNVEEMFRAVTKLVLRSKRDQESGMMNDG